MNYIGNSLDLALRLKHIPLETKHWWLTSLNRAFDFPPPFIPANRFTTAVFSNTSPPSKSTKVGSTLSLRSPSYSSSSSSLLTLVAPLFPLASCSVSSERDFVQAHFRGHFCRSWDSLFNRILRRANDIQFVHQMRKLDTELLKVSFLQKA